MGPRRGTIGWWMLAVLTAGLALGLLRSEAGDIVALAAGGVVGCGLAPWFACRGMRKLDRELAEAIGDRSPLHPLSRRRASLVAQSYVLIWVAWFLAGVMVAVAALWLSWQLRRGP